MSTVSITDKVRERIGDGRVKEGINELLKNLKGMPLSEPFFYQTRNDLLQLSSKIARLDRETRNKLIDYKEYDLQCNHISNSLLGLMEELDAEIMKASPGQLLSGEESVYKVELVLDMDFANSTDEEIQAILDRIGNILRTKPNELKIMAKKSGSIVLEMELSAETLLRLKSLAKIGVVEKLKDVKGEGWAWMDGDGFGLFLEGVKLFKANFVGANLVGADLNRADLRGAYFIGANLNYTDLRGANLRGAYLINTSLSYARLGGANLTSAYLTGAELRYANLGSAYLIGTDLIGADLVGADLSDADLNGAKLSSADLSDADFSDADLSGAYLIGAKLFGTKFIEAKLNRTLFHKNQCELLESMDVDISKVVFVGDDNKNVDNLLEVE